MFRPSLVGGVGYCANDRRRAPLTGSEQRPCWTGHAEASADGFFATLSPAPADRGLMEIKPTLTVVEPPFSGR